MKLRVRPHIDYRDGHYTLWLTPGWEGVEPYADLWVWQWWFYVVANWAFVQFECWLGRIDNAAYQRQGYPKNYGEEVR